MTSVRDREFEAFVRNRRTALVRTATRFTLGDAYLAEDVVQRALISLYVAWPRVRQMNVDAYARRVLVNAFLDERRRPFARRERTVPQLPDAPDSAAATAGGSTGADGLDAELRDALRTLPRGMRSAVVLRYVEDLSLEETADALNCTTGNVKSQASRGLAKLRAALGSPEHPASSTPLEGAPPCRT